VGAVVWRSFDCAVRWVVFGLPPAWGSSGVPSFESTGGLRIAVANRWAESAVAVVVAAGCLRVLLWSLVDHCFPSTGLVLGDSHSSSCNRRSRGLASVLCRCGPCRSGARGAPPCLFRRGTARLVRAALGDLSRH
jgi:hypothetical protein